MDGPTSMPSCEEEEDASSDEKGRQSLRDQLNAMRRSSRRLTETPRRQLSDFAAALELQQDCLLKLLDAQDKHEAMLQSQAKWIVRQVGNMVRERPGQSPRAHRDGSCRRVSTASCPSRVDSEAAASAVAPAVSKGKFYLSEGSATPSYPMDPVLASRSASLSDFSVSDYSPRKLTAPEEQFNLEDKLNRLKESDKNFFFWGLTNSGESERRETSSTLGAFAYKCTHSILFQILVPVVIIANACTIGHQADWDMRHYGEPLASQDLTSWIWINRAFALAFFLELVLRIACEGAHFFYWGNKGFAWNAFDFLIVASSVAEEVAVLVFATRRTRISSFRVVRVLRLVRALRVIRILRFFRELRIMVAGIMNCGKSLLWASLLIGIMTYTFSVVFLQASLAYLEDSGHETIVNVDCSNDIGAGCSIRNNFNSLVGGMYTLFKAMSGGSSWGDVSDTLTEISPLVTFAFCVYIMLAVFVVLNCGGLQRFLSTRLSVFLTTRRLGSSTTYRGNRSGSRPPRSCSRSLTHATRASSSGATSISCSPTRELRVACRSLGLTSTSRARRSSSTSSIPWALA
ncbi:unnamed protein product [Prorocentrum cordatum]|uniref:Ion transport domain-containing protein n=1 Tax=Prorocentrum cordatum TaxID=2364126 RepID=A0ABN9UEL0_9DINO|nr:unnamed protein product [Polarella glacialis]